jgi:hypothetical protein
VRNARLIDRRNRLGIGGKTNIEEAKRWYKKV